MCVPGMDYGTKRKKRALRLAKRKMQKMSEATYNPNNPDERQKQQTGGKVTTGNVTRKGKSVGVTRKGGKFAAKDATASPTKADQKPAPKDAVITKAEAWAKANKEPVDRDQTNRSLNRLKRTHAWARDPANAAEAELAARYLSASGKGASMYSKKGEAGLEDKIARGKAAGIVRDPETGRGIEVSKTSEGRERGGYQRFGKGKNASNIKVAKVTGLPAGVKVADRFEDGSGLASDGGHIDSEGKYHAPKKKRGGNLSMRSHGKVSV